jgi:DNA-binding transcriptional ArsR family regulator
VEDALDRDVVDRRVEEQSTLSQHFKVLRDAGLIRSERQGVKMHNTPRCDELEQRFPGLVKAIIDAHKSQNERQRGRRRRRARSA